MLKSLLHKFPRLSQRTKELTTLEDKYHTKNYDLLKVVMEKGKGAYLWDVDGNKYVDLVAGLASVNVGHCHPRIVNAMNDQMNKLTHIGKAGYHSRLGETSKLFCKTFGYDKFFMANGGTEAAESAVKFARRWGYLDKKIPENEAWMVFASNNYLGRSIAGCAASDNKERREYHGPFEGLNFSIIPFNDVIALEETLKTNPNISGFVVEPIQGDSGAIVPDEGYLTKVRELCTKYNVLMIVDEVQTGMGRTGKLLAQNHENVKADMTVLGKGLSGGFYSSSGILMSDNIYQHLYPGCHGSTYGGNPLACTAISETLKVLLDENICENAEVMGKRLLANLQDGLGGMSNVKEVRGKGLIQGIQTNYQDYEKLFEILYKLKEEGIFVWKVHNYTIRIVPTLVLTKRDVDFISEKFYKVFKEFNL